LEKHRVCQSPQLEFHWSGKTGGLSTPPGLPPRPSLPGISLARLHGTWVTWMWPDPAETWESCLEAVLLLQPPSPPSARGSLSPWLILGAEVRCPRSRARGCCTRHAGGFSSSSSYWRSLLGY